MTFPSGALDLALFLESDRMGFLQSGLVQENLDNQQDVVLQERARGYDRPNGRDWDALTKLQFAAGHPYHNPVIGTVADIEGFELSAVQGFYEKHYRPQNAVLGLVGNFDSDEALARIEHWFGDVPDNGEPEDRVSMPEGFAYVPADGLLEDEVEERTVYLSWATAPTLHPDEPALDLLSMLLSWGRGTRLDDRLYYKSKLATDNGAYASTSEIDGHFIAYASTNKKSVKKVAKVMEKEILALVGDPPTDEELQRARKALRAYALDALELPERRVEILVDCHRQTGDANCPAAEWEKYEAVTSEDIVRVVETYFVPERRVTLSVVPTGQGGGLKGAERVELP